MRYWKTFQKKLIKKYLSISYKHKCMVIAWQQFGEQRKQYRAEFSNYEDTKCYLRIDRGSLELTGEIQTDAPLFFHISDLDVIFKREKFNYFNGSIDFPTPGEIQIYERREKQRFYYKYQDHKNITFYPSKAVAGQQDKNKWEPTFLYSCVLIDISIKGAGMVVPLEVKEKIEQDSVLYIQNLTDQKLPIPFKTQIKYIEEYDVEDGHNLYKIGLKFLEELDSISYKSITSIIEIKQKKSSGLDPSRFCGLEYEDQISMLNRIELNNKQLSINIKDNIDYLDRLRYLTTKMKIEFLQSIEHDLLASALRMSSKELIYELLVELTPNMQNDFLDKLAVERPASGICKAQDQIISFVREKESSGEYVLDPMLFVTYV